MSGSYFDDVLRDPRRYGIENTTDKLRRPGAVRRRRDAVCTESIVGYSDVVTNQSTLGFDADPVVDGRSNALLAAEVSLGRLD
jgi:hypothetical protein